MRVVVTSINGNVGKTITASHVCKGHMPEAPIVAVESINGSAGDLGLEVTQIAGEQYREVYTELLTRPDLIVDVGASNVEAFFAGMAEFEDSHFEIDLFLIPVTPGLKEQTETISTYLTLQKLGVDPRKIQIVLNRARDPERQFEVLFKYAKTDPNFRVNPRIAIMESSIFDELGRHKKSLQSIVEDTTDYRAKMAELRDGSNPALHGKYVKAHILRSQALTVRKNLDQVFEEIIGGVA